MTEVSSLPTEVILTRSQEVIAKVKLEWTPQPGNYLDLDGSTYAVLERRHPAILNLGNQDELAVLRGSNSSSIKEIKCCQLSKTK